MRHRILSELEKAAAAQAPAPPTGRVLHGGPRPARSRNSRSALGWHLLDLPAQLRISTIDSFCRDLALQQPLLTELGGELAHQRAARRNSIAAPPASTLEKLGADDAALSAAIEALLLWRDNGWQEMEALLVEMLAQRDRWMHEFVLGPRARLGRLCASVSSGRSRTRSASPSPSSTSCSHKSPARAMKRMSLARFACATARGRACTGALAELADFPAGPFDKP